MNPHVLRYRRSVVLACACVLGLFARAASAQPRALVVERQGDHLHLSAPHFHFLEGRPLEDLHNGASVPYVFSVSIESAQDGGRWQHLQQRFVVSYDLWEEKFSVVGGGKPPGTASHLSADAAEAWCLDNLLPGVAALPPDKTFVVKLQCAVVRDADPPSGEGLTLSTLIDIFSRKGAAAPPRWELLSGPLRLVDLKEAHRR